MSKYLYLYRGPATPMADFTPQQGEEQMKAWTEWMGRAASAIVDQGSPLAPQASVRDDGSATKPSDQNGYTIVEADNLDAARSLLDGHPFLAEGKGRFAVEIFEILPM
jgi:hypothetical protein